ncbi:MAG: sugar ABC transporter permease [Candidatus Omnitrophica bacterium]|nr:sugar ABC transporter permease [Candidatus Omnitrophota bacterium]MBI3009826.1 sugar ABC transporter permease [Candidatus Omnitrophota bacterium]
MKRRAESTAIVYVFVAPAVILFTIFTFLPLFASLYLSFTEYNVIHPPQWVGLKNFTELLFHDPRFWKALRNTLCYVVGVVPIGIATALLLAAALEELARGKQLFKVLYFIPTVTSVVAIAAVWKWLFAGEKYGLINYALIQLGLQPIDWLLSPRWILPAIMIMSIWAGLGYNMVFFSAGISTIPQALYEAAKVDGANWWGRFWHVTVPMLRPTLVFVVVMAVISSFQIFDQVYIMTSGTGEGIGGVLDSGLTLVSYLYEQGFVQFHMGYASAIAYLIFGCVFGLTLVNIRMLRSQ